MLFRHYSHVFSFFSELFLFKKKKCFGGVQENRGGVNAFLTMSKCKQIFLQAGFPKGSHPGKKFAHIWSKSPRPPPCVVGHLSKPNKVTKINIHYVQTQAVTNLGSNSPKKCPSPSRKKFLKQFGFGFDPPFNNVQI